ncbi:DUF1254 domain-containing protein [Beijerinckia mobilis]|uniref:DUF1254 domain-containing protein n=1 Tax=Beijerinckia mobilis TaxID=231434 RepID=UPI00068FF8D2|nr:hypothetical protein [Beijerinckia mobilis]
MRSSPQKNDLGPMRRERLLIACLTFTGFLCVTLSIHIVSILALPHYFGDRAMAYWSTFATDGHPGLRTDPPTGTAPPFEDPALLQGVCLYDLASAPFRIHATIDPGQFTSFAFHRPSGDAFYAVTDRAAQQGKIDILLMTQQQFDEDEETSEESDDTSHTSAAPPELRLVSEDERGFVLISALVARPSERERIKTWIGTIECGKVNDIAHDSIP